MANRISYLKFLAKNKNALMSDIAHVDKFKSGQNNGNGNTLLAFEDDQSLDVQSKMNQLLMLAEDPKIYYQAMEDLKNEEEDRGTFS